MVNDPVDLRQSHSASFLFTIEEEQALRGAIKVAGCILLVICTIPLSRAESSKNAGICPQASATPLAVLQALVRAPEPQFVLRPGAAFEVSVYGVKDYDIKARIEADGTVVLPLVGKVSLKGLSVSEAEATIADKLVHGKMLLSPQVSLVILDSPNQTVSLAGELEHPGSFPDLGRHTLYEMIASAGGFTASACHVIVLDRPGLPAPVQIPMGSNPGESEYANIPVFPGDSIAVPSVGMVYVIGALKAQGPYLLKSDSPTTVIDAISMAGGVGYEASYSSSFIVRNIPGGHERISINIKKIIVGKQADVALQPNDILFIPTNKMKAAIKGGAASIATALAAAYIYGAHL